VAIAEIEENLARAAHISAITGTDDLEFLS
jgi:hypothetical protein